MKEIYLQIDNKIQEANNIAIITHRNPDWDTIWSAAALKECLKINFSNITATVINIDWVPDGLSYLNRIWTVQNSLVASNFDLFIFLDIASIKLTGFLDENNFSLNNTINIDHHVSNNYYWEINLVNIDNPSTASVLHDFFTTMKYKYNWYIATALLTWIYTDTWSLIFDNTTAVTFWVVADLMSKWWDITLISDNIFLNSSINFIQLLWLTLERLKKVWNTGFSYLTREDILNSWCDYEELVGIVGRLNMLDDVDYMCFIYEKWENMVKWSLRTNRDDVDLTQIAKVHWWWWHKKASAFTYFWHIETNSDWSVLIRTEDNNLIKFT